MGILQETILIRKMYLYFLLPSFLVGLLSFGSPLLKAIIPAHESGVCICQGQKHSLLQINKSFLLILNTIMFYSVNWVFLVSNILMFYKIRHIKDKIKIRDEMAWFISVDLVFSIAQYFFFLMDQINNYGDSCSINVMVTQAYIYSYYTMVSRDFFMMLIICF